MRDGEQLATEQLLRNGAAEGGGVNYKRNVIQQCHTAVKKANILLRYINRTVICKR